MNPRSYGMEDTISHQNNKNKIREERKLRRQSHTNQQQISNVHGSNNAESRSNGRSSMNYKEVHQHRRHGVTNNNNVDENDEYRPHRQSTNNYNPNENEEHRIAISIIPDDDAAILRKIYGDEKRNNVFSTHSRDVTVGIESDGTDSDSSTIHRGTTMLRTQKIDIRNNDNDNNTNTEKRKLSCRMIILGWIFCGCLFGGAGIALYQAYRILFESSESSTTNNTNNNKNATDPSSPVAERNNSTHSLNQYGMEGLVDLTTWPPTMAVTTVAPSGAPTLRVTLPPSSLNPTTAFPTAPQEYVTIFYAIGDVPYTTAQHTKLAEMMPLIPSDAEFVIHVGDMRFSKRNLTCKLSDYSSVAETLQLSPVPVFIVLGDNDWNDCPNPDQGLKYWESEFRQFHERYWPDASSKFNVTYQPNRPDNFAFVYHETLFVGVNIVGGHILNRTEWFGRLQDEANWIIQLASNLIVDIYPRVPRIVIFGHADPKRIHQIFFNTIAQYIANQLNNQVPILYLNGDRHEWLHEPNFYNQSSFTRIILTGQTTDPPLKVMVFADGTKWNSSEPSPFQYDRMLPAGTNGSDVTSTDDALADITDDQVLH